MNAAITARLRFIDFVLGTYGYVNRSAVMDYFGISTAQASLDFQEYLRVAPENIAYDKKVKRYVRTLSFERKFP